MTEGGSGAGIDMIAGRSCKEQRIRAMHRDQLRAKVWSVEQRRVVVVENRTRKSVIHLIHRHRWINSHIASAIADWH